MNRRAINKQAMLACYLKPLPFLIRLAFPETTPILITRVAALDLLQR